MPKTAAVGSMWRYSRLLPLRDDLAIVSLGEGDTPLVRSVRYGNRSVFFKNETVNPTGSHKDRALSIGLTKAVEFGFDTCMLYSDGSAALSSAAYAARAGIRNFTLTPAGAPDSRLLPLMIYGSTILEYQGSASDALTWVHDACRSLGIYETTTYRRANPYESEGTKTISYEIFEDLDCVPDYVIVPVGGGGTLAGIWRGFCDLKERGLTQCLPRMIGVLPEGYRLLELGLERGAATIDDLRELADFEVPATGQAKLAMALPPDGIGAIAAVRQSGGHFVHVSDEEALLGQRILGAEEGIYAEISAAVSQVALNNLIRDGVLAEAATVVALVCGSGFRETGELSRSLAVEKTPIYAATGLTELGKLLAR